MKYLVTGGCGFIGSHLARALVEAGHQVRILDDLSTGSRQHVPPQAQLVPGDVRCPETVSSAMADVDGCYHLAAIVSVERCHEAWRDAHDVNLGGTINVFDACRRAGRLIPVVYASSSAIYGDHAVMPLSEDLPPRVLSSYAADKFGCELHAGVAARVHGLPSIGLRLFNVYGPGQNATSPYSGVIAIFGARTLAGAPLAVFGDGEQRRDFVHVADAVGCFMAAMDRCPVAPARTEVFNVCTGRATSINRLAEMIADLADRKLALQHEPERRGDVRSSIGDPARALATLGFAPTTALATGLRETLDWLACNASGLEAAHA